MRARDTVGTIHQLEEEGMNRPQAETVVQTIADAVDPLATKEELRTTEERLHGEIQSTKVWLLGVLLAIALSTVVLAVRIGELAG